VNVSQLQLRSEKFDDDDDDDDNNNNNNNKVHPIRGHEGPEWGRGIALHFL